VGRVVARPLDGGSGGACGRETIFTQFATALTGTVIAGLPGGRFLTGRRCSTPKWARGLRTSPGFSGIGKR